jgi:predicted Zn-dependent peptidase
MNEFYLDTLPNGLRVVTVEMPHLHSAEVICYVGVGSRFEAPERAGISHFLEHMVFRGTAEFADSLELERAFEAIGGAVNAATDAETTCYHSRVHPDQLDRGLEIFASMLLRPKLEDLEVERRIILEEASEDLNEQGEQISPDNLTAALLWPDLPLGMPTIGSRESIRAIDRAALLAYHHRHYTPANAVIAVTGRVRRSAVLDAVGQHFAAWQGSKPAPASSGLAGADDGGPESVWVHDSDSQVSLQFAFRLPGRESEHAVALRLLRRVLSWGGTSRLMLHLRERLGLTYNAEANLALYADCGVLAVDLAVNPENTVAAAREVLQVIAELCREPVPGEELQRVIQGYLFDLDFSMDHTEDLAVRYGWGTLVDYRRTLADDRRELAAATSSALLRSAGELLVPGALKVAVVGPWKKRDRKAVEKLLQEFRG